MKILFITDNFPPEVNAPATRTYEHCKEWVKLGEEVTVITCVPNFPQGKVYKGYRNKLFQKEYVEGIEVIRVWSVIAPNKGKIRRTLDFISFAWMAFIVGLFQNTDIIIGTSPQFFTVIAARWLGFFKRKPWVMEVRDLWPESIVAVGALKESSLIYRILHRLEKKLYRAANLIVVVTHSFKAYITKLKVCEDKIVVINNGVDTSFFSPRPKNINLLNKLNLNGHFIVGYMGTHGMSHALDFILDCAHNLKDDTHFILQGDGAEKQKLIEKANHLKLKNVSFLPFVSQAEIVDYISIIDVALVNLKRSNTFKTVIPSKIFENASMRKPILLGVEGESRDIINRYEAGIPFIPEDQNSFREALKKLKDPEIYSKSQRGCNKLANDFERKTLAQEMYSHLKNVIQN